VLPGVRKLSLYLSVKLILVLPRIIIHADTHSLCTHWYVRKSDQKSIHLVCFVANLVEPSEEVDKLAAEECVSVGVPVV
jgi:hypothetical protein